MLSSGIGGEDAGVKHELRLTAVFADQPHAGSLSNEPKEAC
jgi:hypothetical protein